MEWSIQQIASLAGTTSRTLRHYDDTGLLKPSRIAANGYRYYDEAALLRLQRILLLREMGLGLPQIAEVLAREREARAALETHLAWLQQERERLSRQIASVSSTIDALREGKALMPTEMFNGFDHTRYKDEVEQRYGKAAYAESDAWWRGLDATERKAWQQRSSDLTRDWVQAAESGVAPDSDAAQALARRHVDWLRGIPGTPAAKTGGSVKEYVLGLAELYVADSRFAANYAGKAGGPGGAQFVRDALRHFAQEEL